MSLLIPVPALRSAPRCVCISVCVRARVCIRVPVLCTNTWVVKSHGDEQSLLLLGANGRGKDHVGRGDLRAPP